MSGSLTNGGGENVPGIPGACATRNFTYLARGPWTLLSGKTMNMPTHLLIQDHHLRDWCLTKFESNCSCRIAISSVKKTIIDSYTMGDHNFEFIFLCYVSINCQGFGFYHFTRKPYVCRPPSNQQEAPTCHRLVPAYGMHRQFRAIRSAQYIQYGFGLQFKPFWLMLTHENIYHKIDDQNITH